MLTKQLNQIVTISFLPLFVLFANPFFLAGQSVITLEECLARAIEASPYKVNRQIVEAKSKIQDVVIKTSLLPQTNIVGSASWQSDVTGLLIELPNFDIPTIGRDQYKLAVDINQIIYDGGKVKILRNQEKVKNKENLLEIEAQEYHYKNRVTGSFYKVVLLEKLIDQADLLIEDLELNTTKLREKIINGVAINQDLMKLQAKTIEVSQNKHELSTQRMSAIGVLSILIKEDYNVLSNKSFELPKSTAGYDMDGDIKRPELQVFSAKKETTLAGEAMLNLQTKPNLSINLNSGYGRPGLNFLSNDFDYFAIVGLKLRVPLTHHYSKKIKKEKAVFNLLRAQIDQQQKIFIDQVVTESIDAKNKVDNFKFLIEEDKKKIDLRENILSVARDQWQNGIATTTQYLEEVTAKDLAVQKLIIHTVELEHAVSQYLYIVGKK